MEWEEMMPMLRNGLTGKILDTLKFSYDRLDRDDKDLFLYIACLFNGESVNRIKNLPEEGVFTSVHFRLRSLAGKSLIRITTDGMEEDGILARILRGESITPVETVKMHNLLQQLGREIVREEFKDPGKRRFLVDPKDIRDVLTYKTGTKNILGICLNHSEPLVIDENSFGGMHNLQFIKFYGWWGEKLELPRGLNYLPRKLRLLYWYEYPGKYLPSSFRAECLVELIMPKSKLENICGLTHLHWRRCPLRCMPSNFRTEHLVELHMSLGKLERLWEGVQPLENLVILDLSGCKNLKEIPDLSKATKLEKLDLSWCESLEVLPTDVNLVSLEVLNLALCSGLRSFPQISTNIRELDLSDNAFEEVPSWIENLSKLEKLNLKGTAIEEVPSWIENMSKLKELYMRDCKRLKIISVGIFKLRNLKTAYSRACSELTSFSDSSVVAGINDSLDFASNDLKDFHFNECFKLDRNVQEFILGSPIPMITFLPGEEVPTYFTQRSYDSSLIITLPQSLPSHQLLQFKACIVIGSSGDGIYKSLKVGWRFRGLSGVILFDTGYYSMDHMIVFNIGFADFELNSHPSASAAIDHMSSQSYNIMEFEVFRKRFGLDDVKMDIKGCGIRLLNACLS